MKKNNKVKLHTVTVGIPAYNAEKNIHRLISAVLNQSSINYSLKKIIVYSDNSSDNTVDIAKSINNNQIEVVNNTNRNGFAGAVKYLLSTNSSDVLVVLNDDILVNNKNFIERIISKFTENKNTGLVCGNPLPLKPKNFIERSIYIGIRAYNKVKYSVNSGNSKTTCDGKVLALSNRFIKSLKLPKDSSKLANVDHYLYCLCKSNKFEYANSREAIVYYKCPSTIRDFISWTSRNKASSSLINDEFNEVIAKEQEVPWIRFTMAKITEFIKYPLESIFLLTLTKISDYKARKLKNTFSSTWDVVTTTKKI